MSAFAVISAIGSAADSSPPNAKWPSDRAPPQPDSVAITKVRIKTVEIAPVARIFIITSYSSLQADGVQVVDSLIGFTPHRN